MDSFISLLIYRRKLHVLRDNFPSFSQNLCTMILWHLHFQSRPLGGYMGGVELFAIGTRFARQSFFLIDT